VKRGRKPNISVLIVKVCCWGKKMNTLLKYRLGPGGAFCLLVIGLISDATYPKHVSGVHQGASADVEVVQAEQKDVPIYGQWIS
jgi:hypothetical protein